jgi:hypothetical protein
MSTSEAKRKRRLVAAWLAMMGAMLVLAPTSASVAAAESKTRTVRLIVDYGDGVEIHFTALKWRAGMTVLDALSDAGKHPRGISFRQRGSGSSALVTQIGDVKNGGGGAQSKNWMYYVGAERGEVSAGAQQLEPSDVILWRFQVYDYNP